MTSQRRSTRSPVLSITIQAKYVDAIRLTDSQGALSAVAELEMGLAAIRESMMSAVADSTASVESDLARARDLIGQLLG